jgi:hypothetical protein
MYVPAMPIFLALVQVLWLARELAYTVPEDFEALTDNTINGSEIIMLYINYQSNVQSLYYAYQLF